MRALACCIALVFIASVAAAEETPAAVPAGPASAASAASASEPQPDYHYVLGLQYQHQPQSPGAIQQHDSFTPVWALRWGRLRLSNGGGSSLMGFGTRVYGPGASAELLSGTAWHLGISLRFDGGRNSDAADNTRGLPDVRRTMRGRVFASYSLSPDLQLSANLAQDLLGRGGGLVFGTGVDWRLAHDRVSEWTFGVGVRGGNSTYMQSYYGVTEAGSAASGMTIYAPGAGFEGVHAGLYYTRALDRHWIAYGSFGASRLIDAAARSPLDARPLAAGWSLRLAYRR
ncbi:MAG: MipA/OmpV family protein [Paucibacter sp.]|nr:MipA/OmpV family protein [Roseateles sp.]